MSEGCRRLVFCFACLLASIAMLGCGDGSDEDPEPGDHLVVSIGDSVASGEGNPDKAAGVFRRAEWRGGGSRESARRCHRSRLSANALAAGEVLADERDLRFVSLGCSGATVTKGLRLPYQGIEPSPNDEPEPPQLDRLAELARERTIDAILVSVGANDIEFSKIVQFCALNLIGLCQQRRYRRHPDGPARKLTLAEYLPYAIEDLAVRYRELSAALPEAIPDERVIIVEYFDPTSAPPGYPQGTGCEMLLGGIKPAESDWARENVLRKLNAEVGRTEELYGWTVIADVDESFAGHGLCARDDRWVTTARESIFGHGIPLFGSLLDRQTRRRLLASYKGTLHPNPAGHRAIAERIEPTLREVVEDE